MAYKMTKNGRLIRISPPSRLTKKDREILEKAKPDIEQIEKTLREMKKLPIVEREI